MSILYGAMLFGAGVIVGTGAMYALMADVMDSIELENREPDEFDEPFDEDWRDDDFGYGHH